MLQGAWGVALVDRLGVVRGCRRLVAEMGCGCCAGCGMRLVRMVMIRLAGLLIVLGVGIK